MHTMFTSNILVKVNQVDLFLVRRLTYNFTATELGPHLSVMLCFPTIFATHIVIITLIHPITEIATPFSLLHLTANVCLA